MADFQICISVTLNQNRLRHADKMDWYVVNYDFKSETAIEHKSYVRVGRLVNQWESNNFK